MIFTVNFNVKPSSEFASAEKLPFVFPSSRKALYVSVSSKMK
jgi:hypothetical protein